MSVKSGMTAILSDIVPTGRLMSLKKNIYRYVRIFHFNPPGHRSLHFLNLCLELFPVNKGVSLTLSPAAVLISAGDFFVLTNSFIL